MWTEDEIKIVKDGLLLGLSASQIASRIPRYVTRNAVIGIIHRRGLDQYRAVKGYRKQRIRVEQSLDHELDDLTLRCAEAYPDATIAEIAEVAWCNLARVKALILARGLDREVGEYRPLRQPLIAKMRARFFPLQEAA